MTLAQTSGRSRILQRLPPGLAGWLVILAIVAVLLAMRGPLPWLVNLPPDWLPPLAGWVNAVVDVIFTALRPVTRLIAAGFDVPIRGLRGFLQWLPWFSLTAIIMLVSIQSSGWQLAVFAGLTCLYIVAAGFWQASVNTLVLVLLAIPLSVVLGFLIGLLAQRVPRTRKTIDVMLDVMQTMPAFAYLIPLLVLFGYGPIVGLLASVIFAIPPMVRNTWLGIDQVPVAITEAAQMCGCSRLQRLVMAEIPAAVPQLLVGINQTTMAVLSMVIVAAVIGGFEDIGWAVLSATRVAQLGGSLLAGLVIVFLAILFDRITKGFVRRSQLSRAPLGIVRRSVLVLLWVVVLTGIVMRLLWPDSTALAVGAQGIFPVQELDRAFLVFVGEHAATITGIKNAILTYLLLPIRVGLVQVVVPGLWGFALTPGLIAAYAIAVLLLALAAARAIGWRSAAAIVVAGLLLFFGLTDFPWPASFLLVVAVAWQVGRWRIAAFSFFSLALILCSGLWGAMIQSVYLCSLAVLVSLLIGGVIGIWAASSTRISDVVRPLADALQTIPQFVFLIPAVMLFKVGDVTALMAIILYAVVPPIRYIEHGLRTVPVEIVESARQIGCSGWQLLLWVKLPVAWPVIVLGINQTIMAALSMLAISAMVGTRDLGQQVYIALGKADAGAGLLAGLAIALLAMMSERIIRASIGSVTPAKESMI